MSLALRLLKRDQHRTVRWKNGKGSSSEIAIYPPTADFAQDHFLWRVSSARLTEDALFSLFPGFERWLTLIEGSALDLKFDSNQPDAKILLGKVCCFPGEETVRSKLPSGPVLDLGLIANREKVKAGFNLIRISKKPKSFQLGARMTFLVGLSENIRASVYPGEHQFVIQTGDALEIEESQMVLLEPVSEGNEVTLACIELDWE